MGLLNDITNSYLGLKGETPTTYTDGIFDQKIKNIKYTPVENTVRTNSVVVPKENRFIITVKTDNPGTSADNQFTIRTSGGRGEVDYDIETSDGQTILGNTDSKTITFPSAGTYDIFISGIFTRCFYNNEGDSQKLLEIKNFGIYGLGSTTQHHTFYGCSNMDISATDTGHFENVTDFSNSWRGCSSLTSFPANAFDTNIASDYTDAFTSTNLTSQAISNILVSIDTSGVINGIFNQSGGVRATVPGMIANNNLVIKGWAMSIV